mmetsp:Transcript_14323/g.46001  ORF Transcript_14323/g.46001 Transcript_14323/m.46001 type:complete len:307 (+) Transcript_14323:1134-2054(+)
MWRLDSPANSGLTWTCERSGGNASNSSSASARLSSVLHTISACTGKAPASSHVRSASVARPRPRMICLRMRRPEATGWKPRGFSAVLIFGNRYRLHEPAGSSSMPSSASADFFLFLWIGTSQRMVCWPEESKVTWSVAGWIPASCSSCVASCEFASCGFRSHDARMWWPRWRALTAECESSCMWRPMEDEMGLMLEARRPTDLGRESATGGTAAVPSSGVSQPSLPAPPPAPPLAAPPPLGRSHSSSPCASAAASALAVGVDDGGMTRTCGIGSACVPRLRGRGRQEDWGRAVTLSGHVFEKTRML